MNENEKLLMNELAKDKRESVYLHFVGCALTGLVARNTPEGKMAELACSIGMKVYVVYSETVDSWTGPATEGEEFDSD